MIRPVASRYVANMLAPACSFADERMRIGYPAVPLRDQRWFSGTAALAREGNGKLRGGTNRIPLPSRLFRHGRFKIMSLV